MANETRLTPEQLQEALCGFTGSELFYVIYPSVLITQGVKFLCDQARAYWLIDCLHSYQTTQQVAQETFQVLDLSVNHQRRSGLIVLTDGNQQMLFRQKLGYTDFPLRAIKLYYVDQTVMLPWEY
ncbi:MAG: hypothetical protein CVV27_03805 [Candidatus Melainabacteria bacterium HGW-Melainabacteria-1]|nr:MAG: hypothetical protein CVV27_03805 [Candidatus Melainabacteria bacterium HGW-Melainabacteria-1]